MNLHSGGIRAAPRQNLPRSRFRECRALWRGRYFHGPTGGPHPRRIVSGIVPDGLVTVGDVRWFGSSVVELTYKDANGHVGKAANFCTVTASRHSKKPGNAPIHWALQSLRRHYAICLYYSRLDHNLPRKTLQMCVDPKIKAARAAPGGTPVLQVASDRNAEPPAGRTRRRAGGRGPGGYSRVPAAPGGRRLNAAPLRELMRWPEPSRYLKELLQAKYPWSSVGTQLQRHAQPGVKLK